MNQLHNCFPVKVLIIDMESLIQSWVLLNFTHKLKNIHKYLELKSMIHSNIKSHLFGVESQANLHLEINKILQIQ